MKSKSLIKKQTERKNNRELVETIMLASKKEEWLKVAQILSYPRSKKVNINLEKINDKTKQGDFVLVPGKVLSQGEMDKKIKIAAFNYSEKAKEKLKKAGCEVLNIAEEIKKNPEMKGVKIIDAGLKNPTLSKTKEVFNK